MTRPSPPWSSAGFARSIDAGADGVVTSPHEAALARRIGGRDFLVVNPGVRPAWARPDDQARPATPAEALAAGASHIVCGRPITAATDPRAAALAIVAEMAGGGRLEPPSGCRSEPLRPLRHGARRRITPPPAGSAPVTRAGAAANSGEGAEAAAPLLLTRPLAGEGDRPGNARVVPGRKAAAQTSKGASPCRALPNRAGVAP